MPQAKLIQNADKAPSTDWPKVTMCGALRAAQKRFSAHMMEPVKAVIPQDSRATVRFFLSALAPTVAAPPSLSKDLDRVSRVMKSILQSVDEGVLSEEEAHAVINFITGCFTQRRMDEVLSKMTTPKSGSWFLVHHHALENE